MFIVLVTVAVLTASVELLAVPSYITPCSLSGPQFEKCAIATANRFFQQLKFGDKNLHIRPIGVVRFPILYLNNSRDIGINITDASLHGLETAQFLYFKKNPSKNSIECSVKFSTDIAGNYAVNAKVGDETVVGTGPGIWTFDDIRVNVTFDWQVKEKDGTKYTNITKTDIAMHVIKSSINVQVDPGNNFNEAFNRNSAKIIEEVLPTGLYYAKRVFYLLTNVLFTTVPYNKLFLE